jgi:hypothetical protein
VVAATKVAAAVASVAVAAAAAAAASVAVATAAAAAAAAVVATFPAAALAVTSTAAAAAAALAAGAFRVPTTAPDSRTVHRVRNRLKLAGFVSAPHHPQQLPYTPYLAGGMTKNRVDVITWAGVFTAMEVLFVIYPLPVFYGLMTLRKKEASIMEHGE